MNNQHPITPPPELVEQWIGIYLGITVTGELSNLEIALATQAAQWGADQELDACITFVDDNELCDQNFYNILRAARRPKPPSLKEQALDELTSAERLYPADWSTIRKALEALPND